MIKDDGSGCSLLLLQRRKSRHEDIDETFGITGWEREHQMIGKQPLLHSKNMGQRKEPMDKQTRCRDRKLHRSRKRTGE